MVVDGARAHIRSDGSALVVQSDRPAALVGTLRRAAGPVGRRPLVLVAEGLAARGASVRIEGPTGRLLTVGAEANAPALRLLTGTRHMAPGSAGAAVSLAAAVFGGRWRQLMVAGGVAGALAGLVAWRALERATRKAGHYN